ncbi:FecCD family ABC transporter permease [Kineococcus arenarius]|uniref:FecCD family ABC transporter permease n=1 Tax=Kineococcus sp. SYSU DK021 TaxID=3383142 RepID=UPI003D7CD47A
MPSAGAPPRRRPAPPVPPADPLGGRARARRSALVLLALGALTGLAALLGAVVGAVAITPADVLRVAGHHLVGLPARVTWDPVVDAVVHDVRLPRVLLGLAVGAGLAVCGTALQAMVRNPLADPQLLGVSSGASTGAAAALLLGAGAGWGEHALAGSAFTGALAASVLVYAVARGAGQVTSARLLLAGVAVGYALHAATSFLVFASGSAEGARSVTFWLLGSLGLATRGAALGTVLVVVTATVAALTAWGPRLDALALGDETARGLGVSPAAFRTLLLAVVSLCVGVLVAASGTIGFVGLVVPHVARRLVGGAHRWSVPAAALLGAAFLVAADLLARTVLAPQELPIGIVTALAGCPFLLWLVRGTRTGA